MTPHWRESEAPLRRTQRDGEDETILGGCFPSRLSPRRMSGTPGGSGFIGCRYPANLGVSHRLLYIGLKIPRFSHECGRKLYRRMVKIRLGNRIFCPSNSL